MKAKLAGAALGVAATTLGAAMILGATAALAVPPPNVEAKLVALGRVVDAPGTTAIYGPLLAHQSYAGVSFARDIAYANDPRAVLDVATPQAKGKALRPVLIYVPGGGGNKKLDYPGGQPFYDNILIVAAKHGMVGVNMQRRAPRGGPWDSGAHDIADVVQWVHKNIRRYGGDPSRIVIWGQSAGANNLSNYLSHKDYWGAGGVGVKAAVLMSGGYNLAPLEPKSVNSARGPGDGGAAAIAAARLNPAAAPAGPPRVDPKVQLQRSSLPGFRALKIPLYVTAAELDPERTVESSQMLRDVLCKAGSCPHYHLNKQESHISEVQSINTGDTEVSGPIFAWFKSVL
jgi:triacylglycerol lipase